MTISTAKRIALVLAVALACFVTYLYPYVPANSDVWGDMLISNFALTALYAFIAWYGGGFVMLLCTLGSDKVEQRSHEERQYIAGYLGNRVWSIFTPMGVFDKKLTHVQYLQVDDDKKPQLVYKVTEQRVVVKQGIFSRMVHGDTTEWEVWSNQAIRIELPSETYYEIVNNLD